MQINLNPDGDFILSEGNYSINLPLSLAGLNYLASILRGQQMGQTKLGEPGAPVQSAVNAALARWKDQYGDVKSFAQKQREAEVGKLNLEIDL